MKTGQLVKQPLGHPDIAGRMLKWSLKLSKFDFWYERKKAFKAKVLVDFMTEMATPASSTNGSHK